MTKIQNPIIGRASKQAGGMVFSTVYGQNVMRSKPFEITDKKTPRRTRQHAKFKAGNELASKVKSFCKLTYDISKVKTTYYADLVSKILNGYSYENDQLVLNPSLSIIGSCRFIPDISTYDNLHIVNNTLLCNINSIFFDHLNQDSVFEVWLLIWSIEDNLYLPIMANGSIPPYGITFPLPADLIGKNVFISDPVFINNSFYPLNSIRFSTTASPVLLQEQL